MPQFPPRSIGERGPRGALAHARNAREDYAAIVPLVKDLREQGTPGPDRLGAEPARTPHPPGVSLEPDPGWALLALAARGYSP